MFEFRKQIPTRKQFKRMVMEGEKALLGFPIPKEEVLAGNIESAVEFFSNITASKDFYKGMVALSISGYDDDVRELYEIEEVKEWTRKLVNKIPYIFYYLNEFMSWSWVMACVADKVEQLNETPRLNAYQAMDLLFKTGKDIEMENMLTMKSVELARIVMETKKLGVTIKDFKGASAIADEIASRFKNAESKKGE